MNTLYQTLLVISLLSGSLLSQAQTWTSAHAHVDSSFSLDQYKRHEFGTVYAEIDGKRLCIAVGGRAGAGKVDQKRPIIYDFDANTLTMGANANDEYHHYQAALWRDSIVVVGMTFDGGYPNETPHDELYLYYIKSDTWVLASTIPAGRKRGSAQCVVIEDTAYFFNGITNGHKSGWVNWTDKYDLSNGVWDTLAPAPRSRDHSLAILDEGKVYLVGGRRSAYGNGGLNSIPVYEIDVYDPLLDSWTTLPDETFVPSLRTGHHAVMVTNELGHKQINLWGGEIDGASLASGIGLDLQTQLWTTLPDMNKEVYGAAMVQVAEDTLVVVSGRDFSGEFNVNDSSFVQVYYAQSVAFPLEWLASSVKQDREGQISFSWTVASSQDGVFFIQKRDPAGKWSDLGSTPARSLQTEYSWEYVDATSDQQAIYRIYFLEADGSQSYSPTLTLTFRQRLALFDTPLNPANRTINFVQGRVIHAELYSFQGQFLGSKSWPASWKLPDELPAGRYILKIVDIHGLAQQEVLLVE